MVLINALFFFGPCPLLNDVSFFFLCLAVHLLEVRASQVALVLKSLSASAGDLRDNPRVWKIPLEEGMASHSSILAWRIRWTEEHGWLQSIALQRAGHD